MYLIMLDYLSPFPLGIILREEVAEGRQMTSERHGRQDLTLAAASFSVPNLWILQFMVARIWTVNAIT